MRRCKKLLPYLKKSKKPKPLQKNHYGCNGFSNAFIGMAKMDAVLGAMFGLRLRCINILRRSKRASNNEMHHMCHPYPSLRRAKPRATANSGPVSASTFVIKAGTSTLSKGFPFIVSTLNVSWACS